MELRVFEGDQETDESRKILLDKHLPEFKKELESLLKGHGLSFTYRLDLQVDYAVPVRAIAILNRDGYHPIDIQIVKRDRFTAIVGSMGATATADLNNVTDLEMLCDQVAMRVFVPQKVETLAAPEPLVKPKPQKPDA